MTKTKTYAVVLCGGKGERFWPVSRRSNPKQFTTLFGRLSLLQATVERVKPLCPGPKQLFVAPAEFEALVRKQVKPAKGCLLLEPEGRNTAPAIGLAAAWLSTRAPGATMVVLPADHLVENRKGFLATVEFATELAQEHLLVTFGIPPTRPDTGYGYVHAGPRIRSRAGRTAHNVLGFREKPDAHTARNYVESGDFLWNSGVFVWRVDAIMDAFRRYMPDFASGLAAFTKTIGTRKEKAALARVYREAPSISIDYAVMEKAENIAVVRAGFDWDDLGSWLALSRHKKSDNKGNVVQGSASLHHTDNCLVSSDSGLVATLGVRDLVIVRSGDAVFVAHRDELDRLKPMLKEMAGRKSERNFL